MQHKPDNREMKWLVALCMVACLATLIVAIDCKERAETNKTAMELLAIDSDVIDAVKILNGRIVALEGRLLQSEQTISRLVQVSSIRDTFFTDALRDEMGTRDFNKFLKKWEALRAPPPAEDGKFVAPEDGVYKFSSKAK